MDLDLKIDLNSNKGRSHVDEGKRKQEKNPYATRGIKILSLDSCGLAGLFSQLDALKNVESRSNKPV